MKIDICSDVGGSFGKHHIGEDEEVMQYITSANVDCGWHGGDPLVMNQTVSLAVHSGVAVGAHPGFPDLLGFGQRYLDCTAAEIIHYVTYQLGALKAFCDLQKVKLTHVKPAGSLYLMAVEKPDVAQACAEAIANFDRGLIFVTLAGNKGDMAAETGKKAGLRVAREFFADRAYTAEGTLVSRRLPDSLIKNKTRAAERVLELIEENRLIANDGTALYLKAHTICIHSFQPGSAAMAQSIHQALQDNGATLQSMDSFV